MSTADETGRRYGRLTVIKRVESDKGRNAQWLCRCDCGSEVTVRSYNLHSRNTQSCGCLRTEQLAKRNKARALPPGDGARNALLRSYQWNAKAQKREWKLTKDQFTQLTSSPCHFCGLAPRQKYLPGGHSTPYIYNGIDRMDNTRGYTLDNVVPCCKVCNRAKRNMPYNEFLEWIKRLAKHWPDLPQEGPLET